MRAGRLVQYDAPETILSEPADKFVHDFVGADRALKRLSRINIQGFIKSAPSISVNSSLNQALLAIDNRISIWVVNQEGQLLGWVARSRLTESGTVRDAAVFPDIGEIAVTKDSTLRHALSIMLGQGIRSLPVTDEDKRFVGEVSLAEVEAATAEKEDSYVNPKN
jgi:osmoprotectant transport system ATP-binding protein